MLAGEKSKRIATKMILLACLQRWLADNDIFLALTQPNIVRLPNAGLLDIGSATHHHRHYVVRRVLSIGMKLLPVPHAQSTRQQENVHGHRDIKVDTLAHASRQGGHICHHNQLLQDRGGQGVGLERPETTHLRVPRQQRQVTHLAP